MKDAPSNMEKIGGFLLDSRSSLLYDKLKNFNLLERNASDLILMTLYTHLILGRWFSLERG